MLKKISVLTFVTVLVFLFAGMSDEACSKVIEVVKPALGDTLTSGSVGYVEVKIDNPVVHLSKYKLFYSLVQPPKWQLLSIRKCNLFYCPTLYAWEVVYVTSTVPNASIKAVLYDTNGLVVGKDISDQFTINPYNPSPLTVTPTSDTICENDNTCSAGKVAAKFTFVGNGVPPFTVTSSHTSVIPNQSNVYYYFKVNAINGSITEDTSVTLTITDSDSQSTSVTVNVINQ